VGLVDFDWSWP
jgi:putative transposase